MGHIQSYTLMHKDVPVLEMTLHSMTGTVGSVSRVIALDHAPVGTVVQGNVSYPLLNQWWKGRGIPASRDGLKDALDALDICGAGVLVEKCFGLSLSDQYWVCPEGVAICWKDINFFQNEFSEDVGDILFGTCLDKENPNLMSPDNTSDGWLKKKWKIKDGTRSLVKAGSGTVRQEAYNEVVATLLCEVLNIPHIPYYLITVEDAPCCICNNFINQHTELVSAWAVMQTMKKPNHHSVYQHYLSCCEQLGVGGIEHTINQMIVLDYLMMNEDRHQGNFGLIRNAETLEWVSAAPIFDTGSALCFRSITSRINGNAVIPCKPFKTNHEEQVKLVTDYSFINLEMLRNLREPFMEIFRDSEFVESSRAEAIYNAYLQRVDMLAYHMEQHRVKQTTSHGLEYDVELNEAYSGEKSE